MGNLVRIRLARWGVRHNPFYGIVVAEARAPRDGRHIERIGTYNPIPDENGVKHIELDFARAKYWIANGAHPTDRVGWLLTKVGLLPPTPLQKQREAMAAKQVEMATKQAAATKRAT
ncbi:ribosomal protein S16 [Gonapodya prolifera JEL478]|uniref:Ribosomal protein S16 n=1 Tax=Gonapodya prolifera (strain JEL478) TaxID=1344416 RepID=A0A139AJ17_GONPJ|nr:ribosomal protein S16 [Gonapodya prolifera JEL478]|eukprot:KXS16801.1 ribosomal protein S16 [Gonapodya prolifera JEL478]